MGEHSKDPVASFNTDESEVAEILGQFLSLLYRMNTEIVFQHEDVKNQDM